MPSVYTGMPHSDGMLGRKLPDELKPNKKLGLPSLTEKDKEKESGSGGRGGTVTSFVRKLYEMVKDENSDVVGFVQDGAAFEVKDPKRLEAEVLPKYFRHSRFQSLVRQLNFYSFKKISKERSMWVYHHALFHRDRPELLKKLKRKPSSASSNTRRAMPSPQMSQEEESIYSEVGNLPERMGYSFQFPMSPRKTGPSQMYSEDDDEHTSPAMSDAGSEFEAEKKRSVDIAMATSRRREARDHADRRTKRTMRDAFGFEERREMWGNLGTQPGPLLRSPEPSPSTLSSFSGISMATTTEGVDATGTDGLLDPLPILPPTRSRTPTGSAMESASTSAEEDDEVFMLPSLGKRPRSGSAEFWRVTDLADLSKSRGRTPQFEPQPTYASLDLETAEELSKFLAAWSQSIAGPLIEFLLGPSAEPLKKGSSIALLDEVRSFLAKELDNQRGEHGFESENRELEEANATLDDSRSVRRELMSYQHALDPGMSAVELSQAFAKAKVGCQDRNAADEVSGDEWEMLRAFTSFAVVQLEHAMDLYSDSPPDMETSVAVARLQSKMKAAHNVWLHRARQFV